MSAALILGMLIGCPNKSPRTRASLCTIFQARSKIFQIGFRCHHTLIPSSGPFVDGHGCDQGGLACRNPRNLLVDPQDGCKRLPQHGAWKRSLLHNHT